VHCPDPPPPCPKNAYHLSERTTPNLARAPHHHPPRLRPAEPGVAAAALAAGLFLLLPGLGPAQEQKAQHSTSHKASSTSQTRCIGSQSTGNCVCQGAESLVASRTRVPTRVQQHKVPRYFLPRYTAQHNIPNILQGTVILVPWAKLVRSCGNPTACTMHMLCKIPSNTNVWTHLACAWQSLG
jgi:hypothetical protein